MARYFRRGTSKIRFVPTISDIASPTSAEITAGTDLTPHIAEIGGFTYANDPIEVPDMASVFTKTIPGEDTADDSTLTLYEDDTTNTVRSSLAKGTSGFIVLSPNGSMAAAAKVEVWPVKVSGNNREWSAGNDPARYVVSFGIIDVPNVDSTIVA